MRLSSPKKAASSPGLGLILPRPAAGGAAFLWLAIVVVCYIRQRFFFHWGTWADSLELMGHAPRVLVGRSAGPLALAGGLWVGAAGVGGAMRRRLAGAEADGPEAFLVDAALGMGVLSLVLLAAGLAHQYTVPALRSLYAAFAAAGCALAWRAPRAARRVAGQEDGGTLSWAVFAFLAFVAAQNLMAAGAPEVFYDSLVYHLALPRLYLLRGSVGATPENVYSGLPLGAQMVYGLGLALSFGDFTALLHALFGLAGAVGLWACVRRLAGPRAGAMAALLFYACPLVVFASWACGVDLASAFYTTAALAVLSGGLGGSAEQAPGRGVLAGLLAGFAAGTKFNVLPAAGALLAGHAWLERRAGRGLRCSAFMAAAMAASVSPWLFKNVLFYGNPFYPFLHRVFGAQQPADWTAFLGAAGSRDLAAALTTRSGFWGLVSLPLRCSLGGWTLGDWPGPVFVSLAPWALLARWRWGSPGEDPPAAWRLTAGLAAAGTLAWALASNLVRFVVPSLPLLAAATAIAVERGDWPRILKRAAWAAALGGSLLAYQAAYHQGRLLGQWDYLRGRIPREDYLKNQRVTYGLPYYAAAEWANAHLPKDAKVLFVGESRGYYMERDFIAATVYDHNPFWAAASAAVDDDDLRARLGALGVTHILLSPRQLYTRAASKAVLPRELAGSARVARFFRRWLEPLWEDRQDGGDQARWLVVYALRQAPYEGPPEPNPLRSVLDELRRQGG